jgi:hypothetical protein
MNPWRRNKHLGVTELFSCRSFAPLIHRRTETDRDQRASKQFLLHPAAQETRRGTLLGTNGCIFWLSQREGHAMERYGAIWDVAAGAFIAVSLFSGMAYIIASALH